MISFRDVAQPGSALHWGCSGRRFKSGHPDHIFNNYIFDDEYEYVGIMCIKNTKKLKKKVHM